MAAARRGIRAEPREARAVEHWRDRLHRLCSGNAAVPAQRSVRNRAVAVRAFDGDRDGCRCLFRWPGNRRAKDRACHQPFEDLGVRRNVKAFVPFFALLPHLVENSDHIAFLHGRSLPHALDRYNIKTLRLPVVIPPLTLELIKHRYRQLVSLHHPDRGGSTQRLQSINLAMEILARYYR